jgi:hypothetical protein
MERGTSATSWPNVPARMIHEYGAFGGWELAGETEVLGGNLPQGHFVHHKYHMICPGIEPGPPRWEALNNVERYSTFIQLIIKYYL